jgi:serine/threonine-protein kinase
MIPDVAPTAQALVERVASVATTLHRLDADVSGASLEALEARTRHVRAEPASADQARRLMLLERQQATLRELADRRTTLHSQLESAQLALTNLKFDLYKLRSAGIAAGIADVNSATQQARAVSRDIGHAVEAAREIERL